ncbi:MAG: hypothetical protein N2378_03590 [Chloroflexaceae bacterium]|nr:hypothetical protein [Chloroflexaceae bacterium]
MLFLIAFGPPLLVLYLMLSPIVLNFAVVYPFYTRSVDTWRLAADIAVLLLIAAVPLASAILVAFQAGRIGSPLRQTLAVYAGLQPIGLAIAYMVSVLLAAFSQAVVEGAAAGRALWTQVLLFALLHLLTLQVLLFLWALLTTFVIRKIFGGLMVKK